MSSGMRMTVDAMSVAMGCASRHFSFRLSFSCAALYALTVVPRARTLCLPAGVFELGAGVGFDDGWPVSIRSKP
jgi:hypothetical protein